MVLNESIMATDGHERMHKLLRGELAAVASYEHALDDVEDHPARQLLWSFLEDHRRAVAVITRHTARIGEEPDRGAGPWGAFATAVETAASWMDDPTTLKALKEGEVHGLDEYRTALTLGELPAELRRIIEDELLPRQLEHIEELDALILGLEQGDQNRTLLDRVHRQRTGAPGD